MKMLKKRLNKLKRKLVTVLSLAMVLSGFPVAPCEAEEAQTTSAECEMVFDNIDETKLTYSGGDGWFLKYDNHEVGDTYDEGDSKLSTNGFTIHDNYGVPTWEIGAGSNSLNKILIVNSTSPVSTGVTSASLPEVTSYLEFHEGAYGKAKPGQGTYISFDTTVDSVVAVVAKYAGYSDSGKLYLKEEGNEEPKEADVDASENASLILFDVAAKAKCKLYADEGVRLYYIKVMPESWDFTDKNILGVFGDRVAGEKVYIDGLYVDVTGLHEEGDSNSLNRVDNAGIAGIEFTGTMYVPIREGKQLYIRCSTVGHGFTVNGVNKGSSLEKNILIDKNIINNKNSDKDGYVKLKASNPNVIINKISWLDNVTKVEIPTAKTGLIYTGTEQKGVEEGTDYTLFAGDYSYNRQFATKEKLPGKYYARASLKEGCAWSDGTTEDKIIFWEIDKVPLTITANDKTITYGDELSNDGVSYSGFVNNEDSSVLGGGLSYAYTYEQNNDAGEYLITPSGLTSDNYDITFVSGKLTVQKKDITNTEITAPSAKTLTYNGSPQELVTAGSAKENGVEIGTMYYAVTTGDTVPEESAYTTSIPSATDVGSYKVWYKVIGDKNHNYNNLETQKINVTIAKPENNDLNVSMEGWTYGDEQPSPKVTGLGYATADITYSNKEDGTYTTEKPLTPGTWWVKANVAETANYPAGVAINSFVIAPKEITITADSASKVYDGTALTKDSYTCSVNGLAYEDKISEIKVTGSQTAVGSTENDVSGVVIESSDNTNVTECYNIIYKKGTLTVTKASNTVSVDIKGWTYGEEGKEPTVKADVDADKVSYSYSDKADGTFKADVPTSAGTWYVKATVPRTDNYSEGSDVKSFEIAKKPLQITAEAKNKKYGESDPAFTYTSEGLVENDKITGTLTRTAGENVGTYAITQGTLTAGDNYEISYVGANLTIGQATSISGAPDVSKSVDYTVDTVGKVTLPANWTWKTADSTKSLTIGTAVEATAEYTGTDKDNYVDAVKTVKVSITRNACTHDNLEEVSEVPATCTKEGVMAHYKCPVCNKLFVKDGLKRQQMN